jgi:hypothetical protein
VTRQDRPGRCSNGGTGSPGRPSQPDVPLRRRHAAGRFREPRERCRRFVPTGDDEELAGAMERRAGRSSRARSAAPTILYGFVRLRQAPYRHWDLAEGGTERAGRACLESRPLTSSYLFGVSCSSAKSCFAVGTDAGRGGRSPSRTDRAGRSSPVPTSTAPEYGAVCRFLCERKVAVDRGLAGCRRIQPSSGTGRGGSRERKPCRVNTLGGVSWRDHASPSVRRPPSIAATVVELTGRAL